MKFPIFMDASLWVLYMVQSPYLSQKYARNLIHVKKYLLTQFYPENMQSVSYSLFNIEVLMVNANYLTVNMRFLMERDEYNSLCILLGQNWAKQYFQGRYETPVNMIFTPLYINSTMFLFSLHHHLIG